MTWRIFLLCFSLVILGVKSQDNPNCANSYNCDVGDENDQKYYQKLTCAKKEDGTFEDCVCEDGLDTCPGDAAWFDGVTGDNIETQCEEICKTNGPCAFYKYVENNQFQNPPNARMCYMMNADQCASTGGTCQPSHCNSGGVVCDGVDPATTTPKPTDYECKVVDGFKYDPSGDNLHWSCVDGKNQVDIYGQDFSVSSVPPGTVCSTHRCYMYPDPPISDAETTPQPSPGPSSTTPLTSSASSASSSSTSASRSYESEDRHNYFLSYGCLPFTDENSGIITWKWTSSRGDEGEYDDAVLVDGKLKEPICSAPPLVLDKNNFNQEGLMITCTDSQVTFNEDGNPQINAPNVCIMTCDFFPVLTISPQWKEYAAEEENKGEKIWYFNMEEGLTYNGETEGEITNEVAKNLISCW